MGKRAIAGRRLGGLEAEVMDVLWSRSGWTSVHEVIPALRGRRRAYTTIMTILTRLHAKGLVERERHGRHFVYRPAGSREEIAARTLREVLAGAEDPQAVLAHFVEDLRASPELLARLRQLVARERRR
jgi:predicted transcriptional regulator